MINKGLQDNYLSTGSAMENDRKRILKTYHILFRLLPIVPHKIMMWLLDSGIYRAFRFLPFQIAFIIAIDVFVSYVRKDYYAKWIMRWYVKQVVKNILGRTKFISSQAFPINFHLSFKKNKQKDNQTNKQTDSNNNKRSVHVCVCPRRRRSFVL